MIMTAADPRTELTPCSQPQGVWLMGAARKSDGEPTAVYSVHRGAELLGHVYAVPDPGSHVFFSSKNWRAVKHGEWRHLGEDFRTRNLAVQHLESP